MDLLNTTFRLRTHAIPVLAALCLAGGCAGTATVPSETLDPLTGATIGRAEVPLRFYEEQSGRAAYARNYVYLGPLWVNKSGDYRYYLWLGIWSTHVESVDNARRRDAFESVTIIADGEPLSLDVGGWTHSVIGASRDVYTRPVASALDAYYPVTLDQIRLLAEATDIRIRSAGVTGGSFERWDGDRGANDALREFVRRAN